MTGRLDRFLVRPLNRERRTKLTRPQIRAAAATLDTVVAGDDELRTRREALAAAFSDETEGGFTHDPTAAREWIEFIRLLYRSRRISWTRYVFSVSVAVEGVHDDWWYGEAVEPTLAALNAEMETLEEAGKERSDRYQDLREQREAAYEAKFVLTYREFGAGDIADLIQTDRVFFDEVRERGRRGVHHAGSYQEALRDVVDEAYAEAISSAQSKNFRAAVTLLGAALEGLLLLRCIRSPKRARTIAGQLPRRLRSRSGGPPQSWTFEVLIEVVDRAGWLARLHGDRGEYSPGDLAHSIRTMRNWIHPAREAAERPWEGVFAPDYEVAHALYTLVRTAIQKPRSLRRGV